MLTQQIHLPRLKREQLIFKAILICVDKYGLFNFSIAQVAEHSKCSTSLIKTYFGGLTSIQHKVIQYARDSNNKKILSTPIIEIIGL